MGDYVTNGNSNDTPPYDVLIVGAGIAGSSLAHALSTMERPTPLRIALLERSLSEPDRIVGELLQPGGMACLKELGLESCTEGIDAIPCYGYCVYDSEDKKSVHIPYPDGREGRSFHHGRFVMALRGKAKEAKGVDVIEATVTELLESETSTSDGGARVIGVQATRNGVPESFYASLVVIADGCFSNFRSKVMGPSGAKPVTNSHFVGAVLEDAVLPIPKHGTVALVKGYGPALFYQIGQKDTRMLIDVKVPLPSDLSAHITTHILPGMPPSLQAPIQTALQKSRLRRMPNSFLPPVQQATAHSKQNVILLGDAWNMRHPLTGGGMTVALSDVVMLRDMLKEVHDLGEWHEIRGLLHSWHWSRKPLSSTVNILSFALYDLFGADDEYLAVLRNGCFKYFERGGDCVRGPVSLLSGIARSPSMLSRHFFAVAFYSIRVMFTHPQPVPSTIASTNGISDEKLSVKPKYAVASITQYPALFVKSIRVFWTACVVFGPLLWSELRWWAPSSSSNST